MTSNHSGKHFVMKFHANEVLQPPYMEQFDVVFILTCNKEECLYLGTIHKLDNMLVIWKIKKTIYNTFYRTLWLHEMNIPGFKVSKCPSFRVLMSLNGNMLFYWISDFHYNFIQNMIIFNSQGQVINRMEEYVELGEMIDERLIRSDELILSCRSSILDYSYASSLFWLKNWM